MADKKRNNRLMK